MSANKSCSRRPKSSNRYFSAAPKAAVCVICHLEKPSNAAMDAHMNHEHSGHVARVARSFYVSEKSEMTEPIMLRIDNIVASVLASSTSK